MSDRNNAYDLAVIGGGAAGLAAAGIGASLGARTLLVEQHRLGGDCTWTGCVPSKTLLAEARRAHEARRVGAGVAPDFRAVMERVRSMRRKIYEEADAPENVEAFGVEVRKGAARFAGAHRLVINGDESLEVEASKVVIATGSRPAVPAIEGIDGAGYLTTDSLFELEVQPQRLAIIGAGPVGTEMAQAFQRLGTEVMVLEAADHILPGAHPRLTRQLQGVLEQEGVNYTLDADIQRIQRHGATVLVHAVQNGKEVSVEAETMLVATGRRANVEGLGLEEAGVTYDESGITVDARCRTSQKHIFAAGDVTGQYQLTHMSEHMGKIAVLNALLKVPQKIDAERVPRVTYTEPELAQVGATQEELDEKAVSYETYRFPLDRLDRAICEGAETGEIRVYATRWTGKILGVDVLAPRAGEMIGTVAVAMKTGGTLRQVADTIFPYPTYGQGVRRAADQWLARKQQPWLVRTIQKIFGYSGPVMEPEPDRIV